MKSYASVLSSLEENLGYKVDNSFAYKFNATKHEWKCKLAVLEALKEWRNIFTDTATSMNTLPLSIAYPSNEVVKKSVLYSSSLVIHGDGTVTDDFYGVDIPNEYIEWIGEYHEVIRRGLCYVIPYRYEQISSQGVDTLDEFNASDYGCAAVSEKFQSGGIQAKNLNFKMFLPSVENISLSDLIGLSQDEEIFSEYHNALNDLNIRNRQIAPEDKLQELMTKVDEKTRELNLKFQQLSKKRTWLATSAVFGFTLAGFSYLLPPEIASEIMKIVGSVSLFSTADNAVGLIREANELKNNPYYFAYKVGKTNH
jgi:hypothetical protein